MTDDGRMLEYLGTMEAGSRRCCDLIERMLRPTNPAEAGDVSESDAGLVAERVCELVRGEAILRGVELVRGVDGGLTPAAIPREDLERVLLDLVRNAVQATRQGGRVDVRARVHRARGGTPAIEIKVIDTGRGIPECALEMIFEPFFSTHGPGEGLGLGLAIASSLVERSNGSIDVESKEGVGTSVSVRLPAAWPGCPAHRSGPDRAVRQDPQDRR
jgi:signal transduction histidine kinase